MCVCVCVCNLSHGRAKAEMPARTYIQQYNSWVPIEEIALKTSRQRWTIKTGGERGSGRSVLAVRHDDIYEDH